MTGSGPAPARSPQESAPQESVPQESAPQESAPQESAPQGGPPAAVADAPLATREAYRGALVALMQRDERVFCLDSDTGLFTKVDFGPARDRYLNLGIAEHNLVGTAAGIAASGGHPWVTTMATFALVRAAEAVKIDVAYNELPVRIAGTHAGLAAGHLGPTHHSLEDLATVLTMPTMTVAVPADAAQAEQFVNWSPSLDGPLYLRLGKPATPLLSEVVPDAEPMRIGQAQRLHVGDDLLIVACGPHPVLAAVAAAAELSASGVGATVLNLHTLRPLDVEALVAAAEPARGVITVEEHWRHGGLGSLVAETLGEHCPRALRRVAMPDRYSSAVGPQDYLLRQYGMTDTAVLAAARDLLDRSPAGSTH